MTNELDQNQPETSSNSKELDQEERLWQAAGFIKHKPIPGQGVVGIYPFLFTMGLCCHSSYSPSEDLYRYRYCYDSLLECLVALDEWDGEGHPPGGWLKRKGEGGELSQIQEPKRVV